MKYEIRIEGKVEEAIAELTELRDYLNLMLEQKMERVKVFMPVDSERFIVGISPELRGFAKIM